jgi:hypothetical protein
VKLTLIIGKDEIDRIVSELTPVKIDLGRKGNVSFGRPALVELVPNTGLRVRGDAKMVWDVAGLTLPVTLRTWQLLLAPSIARRNGSLVLAFDPVLEDLDLTLVPGFFDERIIDAINEGVASQRGKLAWNLSRLLGSSTRLPARVSPGGFVELAPSMANVAISASELRVDVDLEAHAADHAVATPRSLRSA